jgi:hypothetical protein
MGHGTWDITLRKGTWDMGHGTWDISRRGHKRNYSLENVMKRHNHVSLWGHKEL